MKGTSASNQGYRWNTESLMHLKISEKATLRIRRVAWSVDALIDDASRTWAARENNLPFIALITEISEQKK